MRLPQGVGQNLAVTVTPTTRCGQLRLLVNGQVIAGDPADGPGPHHVPTHFEIADMPAGPMVLELEATAAEPLPADIPMPWELPTRYRRAQVPGDSPTLRKPHRSVLTLCVAVE